MNLTRTGTNGSPAERGRCLAVKLTATLACLTAGCADLAPIRGVPANRIPPSLLGERRNDRERIDLMRLRQDPPDVYLLAPRDVLGIWVSGVMGKVDDVPPVHYPDNASIPPSSGFPFPVREDGTISLPQIDPIKVEGLTLVEAETAVKRAYTQSRNILQPNARITVSLIRQRAVQVIVVREDSTAGQQNTDTTNQGRNSSAQNRGAGGSFLQKGAGFVIDLKAYENDVMHALNLTGGLPGLDAKNEVLILHGGWRDAVERDHLLASINSSADPCGYCRTAIRDRYANNPNVTRIPLRFNPARIPEFDQDDIILREGDIVLVQSRERDIFYTGGLLPGGEFQLPRDYDLDVLGAIAISGGNFGGGLGGNRAGGGGGGALGNLIPPSDVIIVRNTPGCGAFNIKVKLNRAVSNPSERVIIQPGDIVLLRYTTGEFLANLFFSTVNFNFLFNGFNRF